MSMGALSLVMQVWLGISRNSSRRSVHTGLSTMGIRNTSPGPFAPIVRPSLNTTRRWYSRTTLIDAEKMMITKMTMTAMRK